MIQEPDPSEIAARTRRSKLFGRSVIVGLGLLLLAYVAQLFMTVNR